MDIISIKHKDLKRLLLENNATGINPQIVSRVRNIITALLSAKSMDDIQGQPGWRIHRLQTSTKQVWSVSASGNWRITFTLIEQEIHHLNLEDYH